MNLTIPFRPKLFDTLGNYSKQDLTSDLTAGLTVGIVALPLAMAFAIASGVPPQAGIFTAVIGGFIISALGGTKVCIGGPTGAFIVILYGIYAKYGAENLALCTMMAGVILCVMGFTRMGAMIKYIPYPVTMGFTSGIAVLIFSTQIKDFLGLRVDQVPSEFIPLAALSAVLVNVALNMGEWHNFLRLPQWPRSDTAVFLTAFGLTVVIDLTVAVEIGMVLAAILFIKRVSETSQITAVDETTETEGSHHSLMGKAIPEGVMIYRMFGAFFFGAADKLESALLREKQEPDVLILRMRKVVAMDATGLNALEDIYEKLHRKGKHLVVSGPHTQPLFVMEKAGFLDRIGRANVCPHVDAALARARAILGLPPAPPPDDPWQDEKRRLETARRELAGAIARADQVLNAPAAGRGGDSK